MKVVVFSVAFAALSLANGSLRAQSPDTAAEQLPKAANPDVPFSAPQPAAVYPGGAAIPTGMGPGLLSPQTFRDKFMDFAVITVGPRALFTPALPAASGMADPPSHYPAAWRQGAEAFGKNYGAQLAAASAFETGRFAIGAALHEDLRYHPSTSTNFFKRTGHALVFNFIDRSDDGHARMAVANAAGLAGGSYIGMSYLPTGFNDLTHADQRLAIQFGRLAGSNLGAEFAPDLIRFAIKHHLPRPQLPIPEWWVKR